MGNDDARVVEGAIPGDMAGERLDRAAILVLPDTGLRGRRRLIEAGRLLVDGRARPAAYRVRAGEKLAARIAARPEGEFRASDIPILFADAAYAAVAKPAGLHSAAIACGGGQSLEDLLPELFPGRAAGLLSRLDRLTSGIVPLAFDAASGERYRRLENAGQVAKTYLAVVHGGIPSPFVVDFRLDMADRAKTRVLRTADSDPLRQTRVSPRAAKGGLTLVACRIAKGARHQIRAHLAASGHPLVGDPVYGRGEGARLYLHCARLESPVLTVTNQPPWSLAEAARTVESDALEKNAEQDTNGVG
ncbi:pseudouridine synthase [Solidesulfovibrio fructosivorans JJ]]|uniref:Pseudouridine synthase n=1 Tax=Solidesulfovibrio fructosivorans JJ] TaxID=596151 RepID=E1K0L4_SOLFR|nr:RNA pseudouridine synthase [Solidesulfovibrio fructosivorans]EFL49866.1 pseudouridine synthase [Solidesulfovibrio fructosivorans JJ]]